MLETKCFSTFGISFFVISQEIFCQTDREVAGEGFDIHLLQNFDLLPLAKNLLQKVGQPGNRTVIRILIIIYIEKKCQPSLQPIISFPCIEKNPL